MRMIKMALLGGAAMAVTAASAQANDLDALKAQIETLNARIAAMETAPSVPTGYQLIAVSEGELQQTPGAPMSAREMFAYGNKATIISVLPTADAPAGTTISWSGYARAGLVYENNSVEQKVTSTDDTLLDGTDADGNPITIESYNFDTDDDDIDVKARGQLRVKASTDTAVGEVGVDIRLRGNFNGNGNADIYSDIAWGYWAMTPELTFGGGYNKSLGDIGYGYDGACSCYYMDNADLAFNPGDVTQLRLSYASGPFSMAMALEDGSLRGAMTTNSTASTVTVSAPRAKSSTRATCSRAKSRACGATSMKMPLIPLRLPRRSGRWVLALALPSATLPTSPSRRPWAKAGMKSIAKAKPSTLSTTTIAGGA
jgi:hypothetical protein